MLAIIVSAYANGLTGQFLFDDGALAKFAWEQTPISEWGWGKPMPFGTAAVRPVVTASFYLDYALFEHDSSGYHALNLLLHLANAGLAWLFFAGLGLDTRACFVAALVFAVHPVQTESVTYISGRRDLLFGLLCLSALVVYLKGRARPTWKNTAALLVIFVLGLQAKEAAAMLPALFVALEAFGLPRHWRRGAEPPEASSMLRNESERGISITRDAARAIGARPGLYLGCAVTAIPLLLHRALVSTHTGYIAGAGYIGGSLGAHTMSAAKAQALLLWRMIFPLYLQADYSRRHWLYAGGWADPLGWLCLLVILLLLLLAARAFARRSWLGLAGVFIALAMLPTSQVVRLTELTAEHYLYLPLLGFGLLIARADAAIAGLSIVRARALATAALVALFGCYVARCWARNPSYADPIAFWSAVERVSPGNARAQVSLGVYERLNGVPPEDYIQRFRRAVELDPSISTGWANLGFELMRQGQYAESETALKRALELEPTAAEVQAAMATLMLTQGRVDDSLPYIEWLRRNAPHNEKLKVLEALLMRMYSGR